MATGSVNTGRQGTGLWTGLAGSFAGTSAGTGAFSTSQGQSGTFYERAVFGPVAHAPANAKRAVVGRVAPAPVRAQRTAVIRTSVFETLSHYRRSVVGGVVGAIALPLSAAFAAQPEPIPQFRPEQSVYCVPACPFDKYALEAKLDESTQFPPYVIYFSRMDGQGSDAEWTNVRTDEVMDAWARQGFDQTHSLVIGRLWDDRQLDPDGQASRRGLTVNPPSSVTTQPGFDARFDALDEQLRTDYFRPKTRVSDHAGAIGDYVAAWDQQIVGMTGLKTERGALDAQITQAEELMKNTAITSDEAESLRTAAERARSILKDETREGRAEYDVKKIKKETTSLGDLVEAIQKSAGGKQQTLLDLSAEISGVEKAWDSAEALPGDKTKAMESAMEKARRALVAKDYAAMGSAETELSRLTGQMVQDVKARETSRGDLAAAVKRATDAKAADLEAHEDLGVITSALVQAEGLAGSRDYKAMDQVTASLNGEAGRLEKSAVAYRELKIALGQTREHIEAAADAVEMSLRDDAGTLEGDDTSSFESAVAEAKAAAEGDNLELMREKSATLDAKREELKELVSQRESEALAWALGIGTVAVLLMGAAGYGLFRFLRRLSELGEKREKFRVAAEKVTADVGNAKENFNEFKQQRERISRFKDSEDETKEFYDEYTRLLNEIVAGIDAMEKRVALQRAEAAKMTFRDTGPMDNAIRALTEEFEFDTGTVKEADFFGEPLRETIKYKPEEFKDEIRRKIARAKELSAKLDDAEKAAQKSARADLPRTELDAFITQARAAGIPVEWLKDHPLYEDDAKTWDELDAIREKNPVGYVNDVIELEEKENAVFARFTGAAALMKSVDEAQKRQAAVQVNFDDIVFDDAEDQDPRALETAMRRERAELDSILSKSRDLDAVEKEANDVVRLFNEMAERKLAIAEAVRDAQTKVAESAAAINGAPATESTPKVKGIVKSLEEAKTRYANLLNEGGHAEASVAAAKVEIDQIVDDLAKARAAQAEAEQALTEKKFLAAIAKSEAVKTHVANAAEDLSDFDREAATREKIKADFDAYLASLDGIRRQKIEKMRAYDDVHEDERLFAKGDAVLASLRAEYAEAGSRDWATEQNRLRDVASAWDRAVEIVDNRQDVANVSEKIDGLDGSLREAVGYVSGIRGNHTDNNLARMDAEIREAQAAIQNAKDARRQSQEVLGGGDDLAAEKAALRALDLYQSAVNQIADIKRVAGELEEKRREYDREMEKLRREKEDAMRDLQSYSYASGYDFGRAEALYDGLRRSQVHDWFVVQAQIQAIREARRTVLASAMAAHRAEESRRAAIRREEERRARAAAEAAERAAEARRAAQRAAEESRRRSTYSSPSYSRPSGGGGSGGGGGSRTRHGGRGGRD